MCGIVGLISKTDIVDGLVNGLEKLEYRGYDSAGIFVDSNGTKDYLIKTKGGIKELKSEMMTTGNVRGTRGIGHTRWATHGFPTKENAHPHVSYDGRFVLVHNGVIENFQMIQSDLLQTDWMQGQTDTEMIVHLIAKFAQEDHLSAKEAFLKVLAMIEGSYAFALIDRLEPEVLYGAKNKSPLLVAIGDQFNGLCSDALAMTGLTQEFMEIKDKELIIATKDTVTIENYEGHHQSRKSFEFSTGSNEIELGSYDCYMMKEIEEQPAVMRKIVSAYTTENGQVAIDERIISSLLASDRIYIIACGTSWHAGLIGKNLLEKLAEIPTEVHLSSEFGYHTPLLSEKPFFIYLSQSGETADSRQVLVQTNKWAYPSLTITNVLGSTLSREASFTLPLYAGPEIAVASTKAYTAQIAVLSILASVVGRAKKIMAAETFDVASELSLAAHQMDTLLTKQGKYQDLVEKMLKQTRNAFFIGRGADYSVSLEGALKLKEISYLQCEGFASGELKHGTIALIEERTPVFALITGQSTHLQTRSNLKEVESRGAATCAIVMEDLAQEGDDIILPKVHELFTPLMSVLPTQLIAYYTALMKGNNVDKPRNLAKSVTVE
ncbi:glutamine--fructose-6-phosphate transaminase (isomerizing) [Vagococcus elongatus]|uniref:Glutamine--fructose-6-phosphate aminotransferase [isomerizing] n=1 Tax=Vagococcus elongatus TaxID=180344 RepID=A0A430B1Z5_9ENTE|nr:glutamine--fructose-6-phosphate transaminase (isomerizing) [Vagococcus elongatus]RSU14340.1 glutamine--fructose-6-phosphate transaminase (isomerizing) [Vagococcus elongatus]